MAQNEVVKIVGVGLNKTGTGTLKACLNFWGYRHVSYDLTSFNQFRRNDWDSLQLTMDEYESFENWPWSLMYKEFDQRYPNSKFILTVRKDSMKWFESLCNHAKRLGPLTDFEEYIYGYSLPQGHMRAHCEFYNRHNADVENYFGNCPERFLKVCWETGDSWQELAKFLGKPVPEAPFPHANRTPNLRMRLVNKYRPILGRYRRRLTGGS